MEIHEIADLYGLPEHFFMPNQFCRHKNHLLVLDALTILRDRGEEIVIAVSGKQFDPRDLNYFPGLLNEMGKRQLQQEFRLLGLIPYSYLLSLMPACTAMHNPSLFGGWSTTVKEAMALGTPMVLSDLDVHREQIGENATYFDRYSAQSLADALENFITFPQSQRELQAEASINAVFERIKQFGGDFGNLAKDCLGKSQHS